MRRIILIAIIGILATSVFSEEAESVIIYGEEYSIIIPDNYDDLKVAYVRVMKAYLEEALDFEDVDKAFTEYKDSAESLLTSKNLLIKEKDNLIIVKDEQIAILEGRQSWFSIIPSVYYSISEDGSGAGVGVGVLLWDSFFIQAQGGYPLNARFNIGWKF